MLTDTALVHRPRQSRQRRTRCQDPGSRRDVATPSHLALRRAVGEARDFDQLRDAGRRFRTTVGELARHLSPAEAGAIVSGLADSFTVRAIELSISELGAPPCSVTWIALGSHGRLEATPGSDMDSALAWEDPDERDDVTSYMRSLGARVCGGLARCGFAADKRGATAAENLFVRPISAWRRLIRESIEDPRSDKGLIVISLLLDGRIVYYGGGASELRRELLAASDRRGLLRLMLGLALNNRPALRLLGEFAVERSGEHRGLLDIKEGGLLPVTSIARYASLAAGAIDASSTTERLAAAAAAGTLDEGFASTLGEAFELSQDVRLEHQARQIDGGLEPDDYVDPKALDPPRRSQLHDAFKAVRSIQKRLGRRLSGELAFA